MSIDLTTMLMLNLNRRFPTNGIHYWVPLSLDQCSDLSPIEESPVVVHPNSNVQLCPNVNLQYVSDGESIPSYTACKNLEPPGCKQSSKIPRLLITDTT